jgi:hypothetical protein
VIKEDDHIDPDSSNQDEDDRSMDGHDGEQGDAEPSPTQDRFQQAGGSGFDTRAEPCDDVPDLVHSGSQDSAASASVCEEEDVRMVTYSSLSIPHWISASNLSWKDGHGSDKAIVEETWAKLALHQYQSDMCALYREAIESAAKVASSRLDV